MVRVIEQQHQLAYTKEQLCLWTAEELVPLSNQGSSTLPTVQYSGVQVEQQGTGWAWSGNLGGVQAAVAAAMAVLYIATAAAQEASVLLALHCARFSWVAASFYSSSWDWHSIHQHA